MKKHEGRWYVKVRGCWTPCSGLHQGVRILQLVRWLKEANYG